MGDSYPLDASTGGRARFRLALLLRAWPLIAALMVIALISAGLIFSKHGRPAVISALMLPDMMVDLPVRPITWFTADPIVERVSIDDGSSGGIFADIYRPPDDGRHGVIIFSMGAPPLDLDDPRLVKLGEDAARAGMVMVVPFSTRLDAELIEPEEVDSLVGIFQYLEEQPYVDPGRVGYIGVSVGGSLALLAAADPRIAERVDYVVSFGGFFNALDTLEAVGSARMAYNGRVEAWEPDSHTVYVMACQILDGGSDPCDRRLGTPEGRAAYDILNEGDPDRTRALLRDLSPSVRTKLDRLSPSQVIDGLQAEVFIIHDRGDAFIPYVESRRLRDALAGRDDVHFTEVSLFEHVEPRLGRGGDVLVLDGTRLYFRLYQLLLKLT